MLTIIDYGLGNVGSIQNMLKRLRIPTVISHQLSDFARATGIILPGVGAFDEGMRRLDNLGLRSILDEHALQRKTPILGICLGMQLLGRRSEEGQLPGLGWIDAETVSIPRDQSGKLRVPHMGWDYVENCHDHPLFAELVNPRFYFVHSYHLRCGNAANVISTCDYGIQLTAAVQHQNILGVQFHPEKSHRYGLQLFRNLVERIFHVPSQGHSLFAA